MNAHTAHILVIGADDVESLLMRAAAKLDVAVECESVDAVDDAIAALRSVRYDAVFARLRAADAVSPTRVLAGSSLHAIPVVLLMGSEQPLTFRTALRAGFSDAVNPRDEGALAAALIRALATPSSQRPERMEAQATSMDAVGRGIRRALSELDYLRLLASLPRPAGDHNGTSELDAAVASVAAKLLPLSRLLNRDDALSCDLAEAISGTVSLLADVALDTIDVRSELYGATLTVAVPDAAIRRTLLGAGMAALAATGQGGELVLGAVAEDGKARVQLRSTGGGAAPWGRELMASEPSFQRHVRHLGLRWTLADSGLLVLECPLEEAAAYAPLTAAQAP